MKEIKVTIEVKSKGSQCSHNKGKFTCYHLGSKIVENTFQAEFYSKRDTKQGFPRGTLINNYHKALACYLDVNVVGNSIVKQWFSNVFR